MGILTWLIVGLIAGWLAGQVAKGRGMGLIGDIVIGIAGALVGGFIASNLLHIADPISGINLTTIVVAFLGAVLLLLILRAVRR